MNEEKDDPLLRMGVSSVQILQIFFTHVLSVFGLKLYTQQMYGSYNFSWQNILDLIFSLVLCVKTFFSASYFFFWWILGLQIVKNIILSKTCKGLQSFLHCSITFSDNLNWNFSFFFFWRLQEPKSRLEKNNKNTSKN